MKIVVDTHTHSVSSGHAYSTVQEMAREAPSNGIEMFAVTDHGPAMLGAPSYYHFGNLKILPDVIYGVRIVRGVEANIIEYTGKVDMPDEYLRRLDFAMASFHEICIAPSTVENHTNAVINVLKNPLIDAVAHPGNPQFQIDIEKVVLAAKEYNKLIEINNHSFVVRTGSEKNCKEIARKCKEYGVRIICGSDSHISFDIGKFDKVYKIFEEVDMPEDLVLNTSVEKVEQYLRDRKKRIDSLL
ncbi:MAG: phosphatase [Clostridia bacterium]|nr:phosphatase [Clostridia bacterium]